MNIRVGFGFDVHALKDDHPFWLGGIQIPHTKGAFGHSDADVLIHAICDALLGAANLGDIGLHFPDTSADFKGIDSKILLKDVVKLLADKGYSIGNIDATVVLEKPKLRPHIATMAQTMADVMGIEADCVSVKATTSERLGFTGREAGIAALATVTLVSQ